MTTDHLTLAQLDRILAHHDTGVQPTGVAVYRQLAHAIRTVYAIADAAFDGARSEHDRLQAIKGRCAGFEELTGRVR